jgi:hypothetical protein
MLYIIQKNKNVEVNIKTEQMYDTYYMIVFVIVVVLFVVIYSVIHYRFMKNYKIRVYNFFYDVRGLHYKILGRTKENILPNEDELEIKKNWYTKAFYLRFKTKVWDNVIDFLGVKTKDYCLFGDFVNPKTKEEDDKIVKGTTYKSFFPTFVRENVKIIFECDDLLKTLNELIQPKLKDELTKLKNVGQNTLDLAKDILTAKDEFVRSIRLMSRGIEDSASIIAEIFGLKPNEIDVERLRDMINNKQMSEVVKEEVDKGNIKVDKIKEKINRSKEKNKENDKNE